MQGSEDRELLIGRDDLEVQPRSLRLVRSAPRLSEH
jgi:hypothetical protein